MLGIFDERSGLQAIPFFYCCALYEACGMLWVSLEKTKRGSFPGLSFFVFFDCALDQGGGIVFGGWGIPLALIRIPSPKRNAPASHTGRKET